MKIELEFDPKIRNLLELMIKERQVTKGETVSLENLCHELVYKAVKSHHPYYHMSIERGEEIVLEGQNYRFKKERRSKPR